MNSATPASASAILERLSEENIGTVIGKSEPITFTQLMINDFAQLTHDMQWIHVDPVRAADGPYNTTIAHGYLVLSLLPRFTRTVIDFFPAGAVINYGMNRVRFIDPVRSDASLTDEITLLSVEQKARGVLIGFQHTITDVATEGVVCSAQTLTLFQAHTK